MPKLHVFVFVGAASIFATVSKGLKIGREK